MEGSPNIRLEQSAERSAIHFEPGTHAQTDSDHLKLYQSFANGNIESFDWNKEVGERIRSYEFTAPALLLTIDGLAPQPASPYPFFTPHQEATFTWVSLPARPNKLNQAGKVYVVKGDTDFYRLPQAILPNVQEPDSLKQQMDIQQKSDDKNAVQLDQNALAGETIGVGAIGAILWAASKLLSPSSANQQLSRRQFLRKSIATATGIAVAGSMLRFALPEATAVVPNEPTEEFLQTVSNIVRPRIARSTFIDGRTALLLAKAEDAQANLTNAAQVQNVVIMGDEHADMAPTYMQDKKQRNTAIAAYAQELLAAAQQVYGNYYHLSPDQIPPQVTNSLLDYVSQVDIVEVTDPGGSSFQPNFPSIVDQQFTAINRFNSPQVEEAIKDLRPKQQ
jgi:hypothetical protein